MISIVVATKNTRLLNQLTANIRKSIGVEHEVIAISGSTPGKGICNIYNEGAEKAKFPFLCFVHEDILFHTDNWGKNLIDYLKNEAIALVGVLGATVKTKTPSEVFTSTGNLTRINQLQRRAGTSPEHYFNNPENETYSEVKVLDGIFLACTKSNHNKYPFDEQLFKGFHGYDIDFSLGQAVNGKCVVIYDILIEHFSSGGHSLLWINDQLQLGNKWSKQLPVYVPVSKREVKAAEINHTEIFLIDLIANRYNNFTQVTYLLKLLALRPFSTKNLYFIRKLVIQGKAENHLKKFIKRSGH